MLIKLLVSRSCIINGSQGHGDIIEVSDREGNALIDSQQGEAVKPTAKRGSKKVEKATKAAKVENRG